MTVYDAFVWHEERELLKVRLSEHARFVDRFIIAEGDRTYSGAPRSGGLDLDDPNLAPWADRIIHVRVPLRPAPCDAWQNEYQQRNALFEQVTFEEDDIVLLSDLDEIISAARWPELMRELSDLDASQAPAEAPRRVAASQAPAEAPRRAG